MTLAKGFLLGLFACWHVRGAPTKDAAHQAQLKPVPKTATADSGRLRGSLDGAHIGNATALHKQGRSAGKGKSMPCQCDLNSGMWVPPKRTTPKCIFIDLGAADGNTLQDFVKGVYGPVENCPSGQWEATLVEANPRFDSSLKQMEAQYGSGKVHAEFSHAAYMCEAETTFYLDTVNTDHNYWGSSMSSNHPDTQASGGKAVTVPTINLIKMLYESTIPGDYVIVKMDVEGAEWDILPCLSKSSISRLIDRIHVEVHPQSCGNAGTTQEQFDSAIATLRANGVDIPEYYSNTL